MEMKAQSRTTLHLNDIIFCDEDNGKKARIFEARKSIKKRFLGLPTLYH